MDVNDSNSWALSTVQRNDQPVVPPLKRRPSPSLFESRCLVLDAEDKTVEIRNEKEVKRDSENLQKIPIPWRGSRVTLFVDPDTEEVTTDNETNGQSNVMLAKLYLDHLSLTNRVLRKLSKISTLYIRNLRPVSEGSSASSIAEHTTMYSGRVS